MQELGAWVTEIPFDVLEQLVRSRVTGDIFVIEVDVSDVLPGPPGIKWDRP